MMGDALHYCIDSRSPEPLTQVALRHYLGIIPQRIQMTVIAGPYTVATPCGWQGYIIIAESHISVETRDLEVYVDVFSCKPFDQAAALRVTCDLLGLDVTATRGQVIRRGWSRVA